MICPTCKGDGGGFSVSGGKENPFSGDWIPNEVWVPCPKCGGGGELERPSHPNTLNTSPSYAARRAVKAHVKSRQNLLVLHLVKGGLR